MERGYVKLWRKVEDNEWFKNHKLFTFWMWCLIRASFKQRTIRVGFQEIELQPGEFIFGRKVAAEHLGMSERNIRTCIDLLRKSKNVTIKTTNKFSIVSIVNWDTYQQQENQNDQQNDQLPTNNRPASDQQLTTNKNIKNIKKEKKEIVIPDFVSPEVWEAFMEHRKAIKSPIKTKYTCDLIFKKLEKWKTEKGYSPDEVLNQSIEHGWKGVFELQGNNGGGGGHKPPTIFEILGVKNGEHGTDSQPN